MKAPFLKFNENWIKNEENLRASIKSGNFYEKLMGIHKIQ